MADLKFRKIKFQQKEAFRQKKRQIFYSESILIEILKLLLKANILINFTLKQ